MDHHKLKIKWVVITFVVTLFLTVIFANLLNPQKELYYTISNPLSVSSSKFTKSFGDLLHPAFVDGNAIETLSNGDKIFPSMLQAIRAAKKTITFESYIYWSGKTGEEFAKALAARAKAKVKVHLLLDWAGSGKISDDLVDIMENAGVEIQRYHEPAWYNLTRMNNRTHRKILVVDGEIGFTGGVGIADDWTGNGLDSQHWRDTHFKIRGPVVNQMQSAFMDNWLKTQAVVHLNEDYFPTIKSQGSTQAQMFISSASEGGSSVRILYLIAIASARKSIHLESAYFVPDAHTVDQLINAKKRGVDIQIIVPGELTDSDVVDSASRELWGALLKENIKIYRYQPALFHCKIFVVDRQFVSVGSTNFDERSFRLNDEANLNIIDKDFAEIQIADFEMDRARSKEITYEEWLNRPLKEKFLGKMFSVFNSQL